MWVKPPFIINRSSPTWIPGRTEEQAACKREDRWLLDSTAGAKISQAQPQNRRPEKGQRRKGFSKMSPGGCVSLDSKFCYLNSTKQNASHTDKLTWKLGLFKGNRYWGGGTSFLPKFLPRLYFLHQFYRGYYFKVYLSERNMYISVSYKLRRKRLYNLFIFKCARNGKFIMVIIALMM